MGTLGWLIQQYKKSAAFAALAPSTKRNRDRLLANIAETGGNLCLTEVDRACWSKGAIAAPRRQRRPTSF